MLAKLPVKSTGRRQDTRLCNRQPVASALPQNFFGVLQIAGEKAWTGIYGLK
jgi:hypothetical protein